ncbi:MAG: 2'-5' RNA ligase [Lysobacterales bacterium]|jgi:2'-5' RNA ligase
MSTATENNELANSYYFWLSPQTSDLEPLQDIITTLSKKYSTPIFEPHATLVSGLSGDEQKLLQKISSFSKKQKKLKLLFEDIEYTHGFFTALYIKTSLPEKLTLMHKQAMRDLNPKHQIQYIPHLSLLYGNISSDEKENIISAFPLTSQEITIDSLKLVKGNADVTQWKIIDEWPLT